MSISFIGEHSAYVFTTTELIGTCFIYNYGLFKLLNNIHLDYVVESIEGLSLYV